MIYSVEKLLKENREKISDGDAKSIEEALEEQRRRGRCERAKSAPRGKINHCSHKLAEPCTNSSFQQGLRRRGCGSATGAGPLTRRGR